MMAADSKESVEASQLGHGPTPKRLRLSPAASQHENTAERKDEPPGPL